MRRALAYSPASPHAGRRLGEGARSGQGLPGAPSDPVIIYCISLLTRQPHCTCEKFVSEHTSDFARCASVFSRTKHFSPFLHSHNVTHICTHALLMTWMVHTKQLRKGGCGGDEDVAAEVAQGHEQVCSPSPSTRGASLPVPLRPSANI